MGDVDLCAPPGRFDELADVFHHHGFQQIGAILGVQNRRIMNLASPSGAPGKHLKIDLHEGLERFFFPHLEDVFARAVPLQVGDHSILAPDVRCLFGHAECSGRQGNELEMPTGAITIARFRKKGRETCSPGEATDIAARLPLAFLFSQ